MYIARYNVELITLQRSKFNFYDTNDRLVVGCSKGNLSSPVSIFQIKNIEELDFVECIYKMRVCPLLF